jgi:secreted trypsin-like serine protease
MRKNLIFVLLVVALFAIGQPALAVKYGVPDNGEHPFVGLIVFYYPDGTAAWRCSGTLISPKVVVTAAHCTELNGKARIYFDEDVEALRNQGIYPYEDSQNSYTGTAHSSPWWTGALLLPNTGDVGVVVLKKSVTTVDTSSLPVLAPAGYLDQLGTQRGTQDVTFQVVGYGLQSVKPVEIGLRLRMKAEVQLVNLGSALTDGYNLHTTNSPGQGTGPGGTCFGDSGGPIFHSGNQIVAVNSFVLNENCSGASFGYRVDRAEVRDWVYSFVK